MSRGVKYYIDLVYIHREGEIEREFVKEKKISTFFILFTKIIP